MIYEGMARILGQCNILNNQLQLGGTIFHRYCKGTGQLIKQTFQTLKFSSHGEKSSIQIIFFEVLEANKNSRKQEDA